MSTVIRIHWINNQQLKQWLEENISTIYFSSSKFEVCSPSHSIKQTYTSVIKTTNGCDAPDAKSVNHN